MSLVPGAQTVHTRESWQDPRYPVFGPLDDPTNNVTAVIHYTAADDLIDGDPGEHAEDLPAYMRAMQKSYVLNRGYSLGYLWAVDWLGGIWQIRGWEYQSAANKGENATTWPILVLVDGDDPATPEAAESIRLLIAEASRRAGSPLFIKGHKDIGATSCPGAGLYAQIKAGVFTPQPKPTPPPPPIQEDDDMPVCFVTDTKMRGTFALSGGRWVPWLFPVTPGVPHFQGDHPWTREQILEHQGPSAAALWRARAAGA